MKLSDMDAFQMGSFLENVGTVLGGSAISAIDPAVSMIVSVIYFAQCFSRMDRTQALLSVISSRSLQMP